MIPTTFINFSNHPIAKFTPEQLQALEGFSIVAEVPFPQVPASASREEVQALAQESVERIMAFRPDVVMCQGEFTLTYAVVTELKARGVKVVSACSDRNSREVVHDDGSVTKESVFRFRQFREY